VTIPLPIRNEFGFKPGTEVEFVAEGAKVVLKRCEEDRVEAWLKEATGVAKGKTTTAKIMKHARRLGRTWERCCIRLQGCAMIVRAAPGLDAQTDCPRYMARR
jgi:bifunctional DNA-binding transcriptional regulator/antitoxin component of YhaV-PrlF toxin-antitoxin module